MLKEFRVSNFKCFDEEIILNLSDIRNYNFNSDLIKEGVVHSCLIYGKNGAGKSSLGLAIKDASMHLTDETQDLTPYLNYTSGNKLLKEASFSYVINYTSKDTITYSYKKTSVTTFTYEELKINDDVIFMYDYVKNSSVVNDELFQSVSLKNLRVNQSALKILNNNVTDVDDCHPIKYTFAFLTNIIFLNTRIEEDYTYLMQERIYINEVIYEDVPEDKKHLFPTSFDGVLELATIKFNSFGFDVKLKYDRKDKKIYRKYKSKYLPFDETASNGEKTLLALSLYLDSMVYYSTLMTSFFNVKNHENNRVMNKVYDTPLKLEPLFIYDEFDAFYDFELSTNVLKHLTKHLNTQVIMTSHNTNLINNKLMRPDCYFVLEKNTVLPLHRKTDKEIRVGHSLEKMFIAGEFHFNE